MTLNLSERLLFCFIKLRTLDTWYNFKLHSGNGTLFKYKAHLTRMNWLGKMQSVALNLFKLVKRKFPSWRIDRYLVQCFNCKHKLKFLYFGCLYFLFLSTCHAMKFNFCRPIGYFDTDFISWWIMLWIDNINWVIWWVSN